MPLSGVRLVTFAGCAFVSLKASPRICSLSLVCPLYPVFLFLYSLSGFCLRLPVSWSWHRAWPRVSFCSAGPRLTEKGKCKSNFVLEVCLGCNSLLMSFLCGAGVNLDIVTWPPYSPGIDGDFVGEEHACAVDFSC